MGNEPTSITNAIQQSQIKRLFGIKANETQRSRPPITGTRDSVGFFSNPRMKKRQFATIVYKPKSPRTVIIT